MHSVLGEILALSLSVASVTTDVKRRPYAAPLEIPDTPYVLEEPSARLEKLAATLARRVSQEGRDVQLEIPGMPAFPGRAFKHQTPQSNVVAAGPLPCIATAFLISNVLVTFAANGECALFRQDSPSEGPTYLLMTIDGTQYLFLGSKSYRQLEEGLAGIERQLCLEE